MWTRCIRRYPDNDQIIESSTLPTETTLFLNSLENFVIGKSDNDEVVTDQICTYYKNNNFNADRQLLHRNMLSDIIQNYGKEDEHNSIRNIADF